MLSFGIFLFVAVAIAFAEDPGKIIGGHKISISKASYQMAVQYKGYQMCGGSLVSKTVVLSAAHCVTPNKQHNLFSVRGGSTESNRGGEVIDVTKVIIHPEYNVQNNHYDAVVLVLQKPFRGDTMVSIIEMITTPPRISADVYVTGWGATSEGGRGSTHLMAVWVKVIELKQCKQFYGTSITKSMFCAGLLEGGKDSCQGDSGGPAVINRQLAGVVSWGVGCGRKHAPGVYTDVSLIRSWVMRYTNTNF